MFQAPNLQLVMQLLNAGKCNLMAFNKKHQSNIQQFSHMRMHQNSVFSLLEAFLPVL